MDGISNITHFLNVSKNATSAADGTDLGKDAFLQLLVTQMKYQDPMSPMQNEDFIAQLAQFSSLEQMQNINDNLQEGMQHDLLMAQSISNSMVTALIGKGVKIQTDQIELKEDTPTNIGIKVDEAAPSVQISIYDANDNLVFIKDLGAADKGDMTFEWDGKSTQGNVLKPGMYRVEANVVKGEQDETPAVTFIQGNVDAVKYNAGEATLEVGGQFFSIGDVLEVRETN